MALPIFQRTVTNDSGDVISGAEITVVDESAGLDADLFSDRAGLTPLANPFFTGSDGLAQFYTSPGEYRISASGVAGTITWRYVALTGQASLNDVVPINEGGTGQTDAASALAALGGIQESDADDKYLQTNGSNKMTGDLEIQKTTGPDVSANKIRSIDDTSGVGLGHSGENLGTYLNESFSVAAQDSAPRGVAIDNFGNFWVVGIDTDAVYKYGPSGVYLNESFSVAAQDSVPTGVAIDSFGNFWVVGASSSAVYKYNSSGVYLNESFSVAAQDSVPTGAAIDSFGNFWVVGSSSSAVYKYNSSGVYLNESFSVAAQDSVPTGVAIDSFGNFWVVGSSSDKVYKYSSSGAYLNISFTVTGQTPNPQDLAIDSFGNFWIVEITTDSIYKHASPVLSSISRKSNGVVLGVMQIDSETNQAAMLKPLKIREPINDNEAASLSTVNQKIGNQLSFNAYAKFSDKKASGSGGGSSIAGTQDRTLNTVLENNLPGVTLSSNNIQGLAAGKYYIKGSAPAQSGGGHSVFVYDNTSLGAFPELIGTSENIATSFFTSTKSFFEGVVTLNQTTSLKVQHYTETATASTGLGSPAGGPNDEIYTVLEIWKIADS